MPFDLYPKMKEDCCLVRKIRDILKRKMNREEAKASLHEG